MRMNFKIEAVIQTPQAESAYDISTRLNRYLKQQGFELCYSKVDNGVLVDDHGNILEIVKPRCTLDPNTCKMDYCPFPNCR